MAFKKNGPGCCCGGGICSCSGGIGDWGIRITLSGTPVLLPLSCPTVYPSGCNKSLNPLSSYTSIYEYTCLDSQDFFVLTNSSTSCGSCAGGILSTSVFAGITFAVTIGTELDGVTAYDGVVVRLRGSYSLAESSPGDCPNKENCADETTLESRAPFSYLSGESAIGGNCPNSMGTQINLSTTATNNAVDVTPMSIAIALYALP